MATSIVLDGCHLLFLLLLLLLLLLVLLLVLLLLVLIVGESLARRLSRKVRTLQRIE